MKLFNILCWIGLQTVIAADRSVIIGDSMYWSGMLFWGGQPSPLSKWLETWSGHSIENHALVGASLQDGWVKSILAQYNDLVKQPNITTLIMDGGGNDVMSHKDDCVKFNQACTNMINTSLNIAKGIIDRARNDGTKSVLYLGFYYLPNLDKAVDYGDTHLQQICRVEEQCYFIDPRYNATTGTGLKTPDMLGSDGLHPNEEGYKILATMIWETAKKFNVTI